MNKKDLDKKIIDLENTYNVALKKLLIIVDDIKSLLLDDDIFIDNEVIEILYRINILQSMKNKINFLKEFKKEFENE